MPSVEKQNQTLYVELEKIQRWWEPRPQSRNSRHEENKLSRMVAGSTNAAISIDAIKLLYFSGYLSWTLLHSQFEAMVENNWTTQQKPQTCLTCCQSPCRSSIWKHCSIPQPLPGSRIPHPIERQDTAELQVAIFRDIQQLKSQWVHGCQGMSATGLGDLYAGSVEGYQQMSDKEVYWGLTDSTRKTTPAALQPHPFHAQCQPIGAMQWQH
jgi:hypothetical protein